MAVSVHFMDVGQGNMVLIKTDNGQNILYDCNVSQDNETVVINYLKVHLGYNSHIDLFINSHREADHMRGIDTIHKHFPIKWVWDNGRAGNSSDVYQKYMTLKRNINSVVNNGMYKDFGNTHLNILSGYDDKLPKDSNCQSIVIKLKYKGRSILLTGDSDSNTWKRIVANPVYGNGFLKSDVLMGSHHGSYTFFKGEYFYNYTDHIKIISPDRTIISVGKDNAHGHPDQTALKLYQQYSKGILRTDSHGHIVVNIHDDGTIYYLPQKTPRALFI